MLNKKLLNKLEILALSTILSIGAVTSSILPVQALSCQQDSSISFDSNLTLNEQENCSINLLAKNCGLPERKLRGILHFNTSDKSCTLVPICNCKEHRECFLRIFSYADPNYMKYYLSGHLKSPNYVNNWFYRSVNSTKQKLPRSVTFLIKVEDKVVGRVGIGPLRNCSGIDTEIGYAIEQSYSGKGITKKAVAKALSFLKYLRNCNSCYKFKRLRATAKADNKASNHILSSIGFVISKGLVNDGFGLENEYFYYF